MTDDLVRQSIAELQDIVRCRCHPAYRDRGMQDPDCECDSADAVQIVADRIEELEAKLDWVLVERDETFALMLDRAQTAEAKLAKAVEECACIAESHKPSAALLSDRYWRGVDEAAHSIAYEIYATLAELTGGKDG